MSAPDPSPPYCEAQVGGMECGQPVERWGQQCARHDPTPYSAPLPPHRPVMANGPAKTVRRVCERDGQPWPCTAAMAGGPDGNAKEGA